MRSSRCRWRVFSKLERGPSYNCGSADVWHDTVALGLGGASGSSLDCEINSHDSECEAGSSSISSGSGRSGIDGVVRLRNRFTMVMGCIEPSRKELRSSERLSKEF